MGLAGLAAVLLLGPVACQTTAAGRGAEQRLGTPSVVVNDQPIQGTTVTIEQVVSPGPGWLVIHAQESGRPGPVLGFTHLRAGTNNNVIVVIDASKATETVYAMLHQDIGAYGVYEFPGVDAPVAIDGRVVTPAFRIQR
jgi:hypothetical protein